MRIVHQSYWPEFHVRHEYAGLTKEKQVSQGYPGAEMSLLSLTMLL